MSPTRTAQPTTQAQDSGGSALLLQRKCACGGSAGLSGECEECRTKRLLGKPLQAKLRINEPGDEYEREADRVADQVMRMPDADLRAETRKASASSLIQRRVGGANSSSSGVPSIVEDALSSPGQPLDVATRAFFEPRFGHQFDDVRIHADAKAAKSAEAVNALAFTVGSDIVFGSRQHAPRSMCGLHLLAHELTHVVQQRRGHLALQKAEVDDNPSFCFPKDGSQQLQDARNVVNDWIRQAQSVSGYSDVPTAIYYQLGEGFKTVAEKRIADLPATQARHVSYEESRYRFSPIRATGWPKAPVINLCGVCVGADKLGHFFQQGSEYFRIGENLRRRIYHWTAEQRRTFLEQVQSDSSAAVDFGIELEGELSLPPSMEEDSIIAAYTHEYGKWLEGFPHRLSDDEIGWLNKVLGFHTIEETVNNLAGSSDAGGERSEVMSKTRFFGYYGRLAGGVLSRGDLEANKQGGLFYLEVMRAPRASFDICSYVNDQWNEYSNPSTFEGTPLHVPISGPSLPIEERQESIFPVPASASVERIYREIHFETGSADPDPTELQKLAFDLAWYESNIRDGRYHLYLRGHASRLGTTHTNLSLSQERAEAIVPRLEQLLHEILQSQEIKLTPTEYPKGLGESRAEDRNRQPNDDSSSDRVVSLVFTYW